MVFYGETQIGNISFKITDKKNGEYGGIVIPNTKLDSWLKLIDSPQFHKETENLGWYSLQHEDEHVIFQLTTIDNTYTGQEKTLNKSPEMISGYEYLFLVIPVVVLTSVVGLVTIYRNNDH